MTDLFEKHRNPDGKTYNGVALLSELSGLTQAEIAWTANRLKHLIQVEKKSKAEAKEIVKRESRSFPWLAK